MARKELKVASVMVRMEPSLYDAVVQYVNSINDSGSTWFRELAIQELERRGMLGPDLKDKLVGARWS
jgi:hypothetical protein